MRSVKVFLVAILIAVLFSIGLAQSSGLPRLKKSESYAMVRVKMIKAGWKPYHSPDAQDCGGDARCEGRPEMEACAGTGMANCVFLWKRKGKTVEILTTGENPVYEKYKFR